MLGLLPTPILAVSVHGDGTWWEAVRRAGGQARWAAVGPESLLVRDVPSKGYREMG